MTKNWTLYILQCADGTLYTGITDDFPRRLNAHNAGKGAKYTRGRGPVVPVYLEQMPDKSHALRRERAIKALTRQQKLALCREHPLPESMGEHSPPTNTPITNERGATMEQLSYYLEELGGRAQEACALLLELAQIPAPSHNEEQRAAFCKAWLEGQGVQGVYIDSALNVICPMGDVEHGPITVYLAHSDVVFPDTTPLPLEVKDGRIYCPGIGDDTANVVALLMTASVLARHNLKPKTGGLLLVVNAAEEGLGDLKGCRRLMADFGDRIREFVSLDDHDCKGVDRAVGSRRYEVELKTQGGHSFNDFGRPNAIAVLAAMIRDLYEVQLPPAGRTTYNVGLISGGTSVNTIAQQAEMLYEFRSDERTSLDFMEAHFRACVELYRTRGYEVTVTPVGNRPCSGDVDPQAQEALRLRAARAVEESFGRPCTFGPGSTDCNIPLSMGIPAVCVGCYSGDGAHTRQEYVEIDSLAPGLEVALRLVLQGPGFELED